jgi:hypothetical protein
MSKPLGTDKEAAQDDSVAAVKAPESRDEATRKRFLGNFKARYQRRAQRRLTHEVENWIDQVRRLPGLSEDEKKRIQRGVLPLLVTYARYEARQRIAAAWYPLLATCWAVVLLIALQPTLGSHKLVRNTGAVIFIVATLPTNLSGLTREKVHAD